jgi:signal peptidase II
MIYTVMFLILAFDQITKYLALQNITQPITVTSFLNFILVFNKGVSFSLFSFDKKSMTWLLTVVIILITGYFVKWMFETKQKFLKFCLALICGGAVGNLIDRFRYGAVVDFIDFHIGARHWPAFNIADSAVCIGAALLLVYSFTVKDR